MENQNPNQILKGDQPENGGRPWWVWLIIFLVVAAIIYALVRYFILGQGTIGPPVTPSPTTTPAMEPTSTPTITPESTPFEVEIEVTETPRTGLGDESE